MKVVISTCDKHSWIIPISMYFLKKYWPDLPYPVDIITETGYIDGCYGNQFDGGGLSWSDGLINYLKQSDENKILLILEDHLIQRPVIDWEVKLAESLCHGKIGCVRLNNAPHRYLKAHTFKADAGFFRDYRMDQRFALTLQMAIWQKEFLLEFLRAGENVWEVEKLGTKRVNESKSEWRVLWPVRNIITYPPRGLLRKGILEPGPLKWAFSELEPESECYKILAKAIKNQLDEHRK